jgi:hypothetical protein
MTDDDRTPIDQVVEHAADLFVYAPIGLFFEGPSLLPKLAEKGRVHARNARLFGQFAVRHGEAEVRRRVGDLEEQATGVLRLFGLVDDPGADLRSADAPSAETASADMASADVRSTAPSSATSGVETVAAPVTVPAATGNGQAPPPPATVDLAITDYDSLSASQVVTRLEGLTVDELEAVRAYEAAHRGRKTILNKVAQLQG